MKRLGTTAVLAAAALAAAACGSNSTGSAGSTKPSAAPSQSAAPSLAGKRIEVAAEWSKDEQAAFTKVLAGFEKQTGAKVTYTSLGSNTATILGTRVAGGNPPDVALIPQPGLIQQFVDKHQVTPLPAAAEAAVQANFPAVWQQLGTFSGKPYAVWFKAANKSTVWYRPDTFATAGVSEPKTWDDFTKALATIRDSGTTPLSIGGADGWTLTDWFENVYIRTAGAAKYDQLTKHQIPWTDPSVTTALTKLTDIWKQKDLIAPNAIQTDFPGSVTQVFGPAKKAAVVYEGDFVASAITGSTKAKIGTDAKFFPFPTIGSTPSSVVGGGDAAVILKDSPAAEALLTYLASPAAADVWVKVGGFTSPNKNVPLADYPDDTSRQIAQQLVGAQVFRFDMSDQEPAQFGGTPGQGEWKDLQGLLTNPTDIAGTQQKLETDAKAAYK